MNSIRIRFQPRLHRHPRIILALAILILFVYPVYAAQLQQSPVSPLWCNPGGECQQLKLVLHAILQSPPCRKLYVQGKCPPSCAASIRAHASRGIWSRCVERCAWGAAYTSALEHFVDWCDSRMDVGDDKDTFDVDTKIVMKAQGKSNAPVQKPNAIEDNDEDGEDEREALEDIGRNALLERKNTQEQEQQRKQLQRQVKQRSLHDEDEEEEEEMQRDMDQDLDENQEVDEKNGQDNDIGEVDLAEAHGHIEDDRDRGTPVSDDRSIKEPPPSIAKDPPPAEAKDKVETNQASAVVNDEPKKAVGEKKPRRFTVPSKLVSSSIKTMEMTKKTFASISTKAKAKVATSRNWGYVILAALSIILVVGSAMGYAFRETSVMKKAVIPGMKAIRKEVQTLVVRIRSMIKQRLNRGALTLPHTASSGANANVAINIKNRGARRHMQEDYWKTLT